MEGCFAKSARSFEFIDLSFVIESSQKEFVHFVGKLQTIDGDCIKRCFTLSLFDLFNVLFEFVIDELRVIYERIALEGWRGFISWESFNFSFVEEIHFF